MVLIAAFLEDDVFSLHGIKATLLEDHVMASKCFVDRTAILAARSVEAFVSCKNWISPRHDYSTSILTMSRCFGSFYG